MTSLDTARMADGRLLPVVCPGPALPGSPLSLSGTTPASAGPVTTSPAVVIYATEAAHLSLDGDASADDLPVPANAWVVVPVRSGAPLSFRLVSASSGTVWVHAAATLSD